MGVAKMSAEEIHAKHAEGLDLVTQAFQELAYLNEGLSGELGGAQEALAAAEEKAAELEGQVAEYAEKYGELESQVPHYAEKYAHKKEKYEKLSKKYEEPKAAYRELAERSSSSSSSSSD